MTIAVVHAMMLTVREFTYLPITRLRLMMISISTSSSGSTAPCMTCA